MTKHHPVTAGRTPHTHTRCGKRPQSATVGDLPAVHAGALP